MITAIREVRRARGLTLDDVARRCVPPTTAQTIGRLETGTRTVSVAWLNRIADALGVAAGDLVTLPDRGELAVAAVLTADGALAPRRAIRVAPPHPAPGGVAVTVAASIGDYRAGDELWCEMLAPADYPRALNHDVLAPAAAGRFVFGRLVGLEEDAPVILPPARGGRAAPLAPPAWMARVARLIRGF